jgi:hypothetical protein
VELRESQVRNPRCCVAAAGVVCIPSSTVTPCREGWGLSACEVECGRPEKGDEWEKGKGRGRERGREWEKTAFR